jgi:hypothetical protein
MRNGLLTGQPPPDGFECCIRRILHRHTLRQLLNRSVHVQGRYNFGRGGFERIGSH